MVPGQGNQTGGSEEALSVRRPACTTQAFQNTVEDENRDSMASSSSPSRITGTGGSRPVRGLPVLVANFPRPDLTGKARASPLMMMPQLSKAAQESIHATRRLAISELTRAILARQPSQLYPLERSCSDSATADKQDPTE